jgi:uncharacterized membrane protein
MENHAVSILLKWVHLMATVAWIGAMFTNFFIYLPAIRKVLDPPTAGKLMGIVMNRFKVMVYISMGLFLITGMSSGFIHVTYAELASAENSWNTLLTIKIGIFVLMAILAIYAFEFLAPKVAKIAASGPSPELARIQKSQMALAAMGFILGIIIVAISAAL